MQVKDLKPNKLNPRKITDKRLELLRDSLEYFGDLNCIVFNRRSKTLISGHQRCKSLPADSKVIYEKKYDSSTKCMTVAEGYIEFNGEKFKYREVEADKEWESEALMAANSHGGEFDQDLVKIFMYENKNLNIQRSGVINIPMPIVNIESPKINIEINKDEPIKEETDEQYLRDFEHDESYLAKEEIDSVNRDNPFEDLEEKTQSKNEDIKRIVVIIRCPTEEAKKELKKRIQQDVIQTECEIF